MVFSRHRERVRGRRGSAPPACGWSPTSREGRTAPIRRGAGHFSVACASKAGGVATTCEADPAGPESEVEPREEVRDAAEVHLPSTELSETKEQREESEGPRPAPRCGGCGVQPAEHARDSGRESRLGAPPRDDCGREGSFGRGW